MLVIKRFMKHRRQSLCSPRGYNSVRTNKQWRDISFISCFSYKNKRPTSAVQKYPSAEGNCLRDGGSWDGLSLGRLRDANSPSDLSSPCNNLEFLASCLKFSLSVSILPGFLKYTVLNAEKKKSIYSWQKNFGTISKQCLKKTIYLNLFEISIILSYFPDSLGLVQFTDYPFHTLFLFKMGVGPIWMSVIYGRKEVHSKGGK